MIGSKEAVELLITTINDENPEVRKGLGVNVEYKSGTRGKGPELPIPTLEELEQNYQRLIKQVRGYIIPE